MVLYVARLVCVSTQDNKNMNEYWNHPPEDPAEPPECCGEFMDVTDEGACVCKTCGKRIEPEKYEAPDLS